MWMPDSWVNTASPTMLLLKATLRPEARSTRREMPSSARVSMPVCPWCRWRRPITTSSRAALPARSPRPLTVVLAWLAPARRPARVLAVARPRSSWAWTSISRSTAARRRAIASWVANGSSTPSVSAKRMRRAPQAWARRATRSRKSGSAREASSAPTEMCRPLATASSSTSVIWRSTASRDWRSLCCRWMSDTGIDRWMMSAPVRSAWCRSPRVMRPHTIRRTGRPRATMASMLASSSWPMAGMPISISGTPAWASALAMAHFSASVNATPAVCSPSRKVVSLITSEEVMGGVLPVPSSQSACHGPQPANPTRLSRRRPGCRPANHGFSGLRCRECAVCNTRCGRAATALKGGHAKAARAGMAGPCEQGVWGQGVAAGCTAQAPGLQASRAWLRVWRGSSITRSVSRTFTQQASRDWASRPQALSSWSFSSSSGGASEAAPLRTCTWQVAQAATISQACSMAMPASSRPRHSMAPRRMSSVRPSGHRSGWGSRVIWGMVGPTSAQAVDQLARQGALDRGVHAPGRKLGGLLRQGLAGLAHALQRGLGLQLLGQPVQGLAHPGQLGRVQQGLVLCQRALGGVQQAPGIHLGLAQGPQLHVGAGGAHRVLQHGRDLAVLQTVRGLDLDMGLYPAGLLAGAHRQQAIGIDLEGHLDARRSGHRRRDAAQLEARQAAALGHAVAFTLHHVQGHGGLAVLEGGELLGPRHRQGGVARDDLLHQAAHGLQPQRQRAHVQQQPGVLAAIAGQHI